ncbi:MAG: oxidoreductase [Mogibacterium sp.]|nr:oxidoreductase [Mogibacterium sp.]
MKQTARIISTYSADVMGVCSALFELGGMTVMHDASGCNSTYTTHDEPRWYDMDSMVYISGISEMEAIMGDDEKLISDIVDAAEVLKPAFIAIAGTPIPTMTGFDFEAVASVIEHRTGIPSFGFPTTGMNTYIHGASMAFAGIAERFVDDPDNNKNDDSNTLHMSARKLVSVLNSCCMRPNGIKINVLGLTPLDFSVNGTDDSIVQWLEREGFEVISKWAMGSSLEEIRRSAEADVNLVVSAAGYGAARVLYERFGMPYAIGFPAGNELPGLLADQIIINVKRIKEQAEDGSFGRTFESAEISVDSGIFLDGSTGKDGSTYEKGFAAVIGEGVISLSLAGAIELECGIPAKVLCATECPEEILRECDRMTPDEDDIIPELEGAAFVIADPLYRPIVPENAEFISLPSEAFSGRIYRDEIPDLAGDINELLIKIK